MQLGVVVGSLISRPLLDIGTQLLDKLRVFWPQLASAIRYEVRADASHDRIPEVAPN